MDHLNLRTVQGSHRRAVRRPEKRCRTTPSHNPDADQYSAKERREKRRGHRGTGSLQLNFYVAPGGGCEPTRKGSLQYRRLLLACAMTGEFAAAWLPSMLVPLVGILAPAVAMALLFNVIEARD